MSFVYSEVSFNADHIEWLSFFTTLEKLSHDRTKMGFLYYRKAMGVIIKCTSLPTRNITSCMLMVSLSAIYPRWNIAHTHSAEMISFLFYHFLMFYEHVSYESLSMLSVRVYFGLLFVHLSVNIYDSCHSLLLWTIRALVVWRVHHCHSKVNLQHRNIILLPLLISRGHFCYRFKMNPYNILTLRKSHPRNRKFNNQLHLPVIFL